MLSPSPFKGLATCGYLSVNSLELKNKIKVQFLHHASHISRAQQPNARIKKTESSRLNLKKRIYNMLPQEIHFRVKDTHRLKVRGWKKIYGANGNSMKAGVAILISDKTDFKQSQTQLRD